MQMTYSRETSLLDNTRISRRSNNNTNAARETDGATTHATMPVDTAPPPPPIPHDDDNPPPLVEANFLNNTSFLSEIFTRHMNGNNNSNPFSMSFEVDLRRGGDETLENIPTVKQINEATIVESYQSSESHHELCSVCLESFEDRQVTRKILECQHNFHITCIDHWFEKSGACPVCRLSIISSTTT